METISPYFLSSQKTSTMTIANTNTRKRTHDERDGVEVEVSHNETVGSQHVKSDPEVDGYGSNIVTNGYLPAQMQNADVKKEFITHVSPPKKKRDRFNGTTEEEVMKMTLPDRIKPGLDILIIGINPGLTAAYVGHHYAGPGNHFWKCLFMSGLIPEPYTAYDDTKLPDLGIGLTSIVARTRKCLYSSGLIPEPLTAFQDEKALDYGIGLCNIVDRTTRGSNNLSRKEIKEGGEILREKVKQYRPKIAVFNGKGIYEVFCGNKKFNFGKQPSPMSGTDTLIYVMPSSSARCSQLPRAADKVPFYVALKKLRDHLCGRLPDLKESEVCFPDLELKCPPRIKTEPQVTQGHVQKIVQRRKKLVNGHLVDDNGIMNASNKTLHRSSTPTLAVQDDIRNFTNSSGLPGYPGFPGMGFQPLPIHPAFSTAANTMVGTVPISCTASSTFPHSNAQITSQHGSISVSNHQSQRQSMPNRNQEPTWTRPSTPPQTVTLADSTAHIPCTSSAVLTSEWINKHFNNPIHPPYNIDGSWTTHAEQHGLQGKSLWHLGNGYMKHEMPSDGYGSVPPSR